MAMRPAQTRPVPLDSGTGAAGRVIRIGSRITLVVNRRSARVSWVLLAIIVVASVLSLVVGTLGVSWEQLGALLTGEAERKTIIVLEVLRGPRIVVGLAAGAALGISGTLFQTVTRNPLGSPDIIGLTAGASAGAAAAALVWPGIVPVPVGALIVALLAVVIIYFGTGKGFQSSSRLIIVGIGVSAMALAFVQWAIAGARREDATVLASYLNGSLNARTWDHALIIVAALLICIPLLLVLAPRLNLSEMGDETADALGARISSARPQAVLLGTALATAAVVVAGPIAFVALVAPHIAKRVSHTAGLTATNSALMGAVLLVTADLIAQHAPLPVSLPVGILTAAIGGIYLGFMLVTQWKKESA